MKVSTFILMGTMAIAGLSSCTTMMYVQKHYGPEIITEKKPARIAYINNLDYTNPDIVKDKHQSTYRRAVRGFTKGITEGMSSCDSIKLIIADTLRKATGAGDLTSLLPIEVISEFCTDFNVSMLIALDSVNIDFYTEDDYLESIVLVNFYSRKVLLFAEYFLSVYSPDGDLINRSSVDKSTYYSWRMSLTAAVAFSPSIAAASSKIERLAVPCGLDYSSKFLPNTETLQRIVYTGTRFTGSNNLMKSGKWGEAVKILNELSRSSNKSIANRARMNLEVAKEGAGM